MWHFDLRLCKFDKCPRKIPTGMMATPTVGKWLMDSGKPIVKQENRQCNWDRSRNKIKRKLISVSVHSVIPLCVLWIFVHKLTACPANQNKSTKYLKIILATHNEQPGAYLSDYLTTSISPILARESPTGSHKTTVIRLHTQVPHGSWVKRSEQLTLVRWVSCADLLKKGSCWYAAVILFWKLNIMNEILKTYLLWFCATLQIPAIFFTILVH